jgi:hypothetical protein
MSFLSGLKVFGSDVAKVFSWFGSPRGTAIVQAGEVVLESADPALVPVVSLFNSWAQKAYNIEAIAVAAGQNANSGTDKAAAVISAMTTAIIQYAHEEGLPARTASQIQTANDAAVAFINAMTAPATA